MAGRPTGTFSRKRRPVFRQLFFPGKEFYPVRCLFRVHTAKEYMRKICIILLASILLTAISLPAFAEGEDIHIDPVHSSQEYKDMLMDSFDRTVLGQNANVREQLRKILYLDSVTVDAAAYNAIISSVNDAISSRTLSPGASLDSYTKEDLEIAVSLISQICNALDLDFTMDPSIDSQNEYARVITIRKDGIVLGKINSDAKTDVAGRGSVIWLIFAGSLAILGVSSGMILLTRKEA